MLFSKATDNNQIGVGKVGRCISIGNMNNRVYLEILSPCLIMKITSNSWE